MKTGHSKRNWNLQLTSSISKSKLVFALIMLEEMVTPCFSVYADSAVLCRTLYQRIQANIGIRPVSVTQVVGLATSGGFEFFSVVVYPQRKFALF